MRDQLIRGVGWGAAEEQGRFGELQDDGAVVAGREVDAGVGQLVGPPGAAAGAAVATARCRW